jgi:hypothetical protein
MRATRKSAVLSKRQRGAHRLKLLYLVDLARTHEAKTLRMRAFAMKKQAFG